LGYGVDRIARRYSLTHTRDLVPQSAQAYRLSPLAPAGDEPDQPGLLLLRSDEQLLRLALGDRSLNHRLGEHRVFVDACDAADLGGRNPDAGRDLPHRVPLGEQPPVGLGLLLVGQVRTLYVLSQSIEEGLLRRRIPDDHRHLIDAGNERGAVAALPHHDAVAVAEGPDTERLQDAALTDARR